jgi:hypothetical protein
MFKRSLTALAAALTLGLAAASAHADAVSLLNFDADAAAAPLAPPSTGASAGLVLVEDDAANNLSGVAPWVFKSQLLLETALGETDPNSPRFTSYSGWSFSFDAVAGTTYAYTYNFFSNLGLTDVETADFFVLVDDGFGAVDFVSHASDDGSLVAGGPLAYQTGVQRREFTALTSGPYTFSAFVGTSQVGCLDATDCIPSFAVINGVPEPGTFALAGLALFGIVAPRLRRRELH